MAGVGEWNRRFGSAAERFAAEWLRRRGLQILERGYRCREGELDIVALDGREWVVVEVKARSSARWGGAVSAVGRRKRQRILRATRRLLWERDRMGAPVRFDVVAIRRRSGRLEVDWIRDAFRP